MVQDKQSKTYLFVDGTNFYAGQFELFGPGSYIDFSSFIVEVEEQLKIHFDRIYFYASYSPKSKRPTTKEKQYLKNEGLFYRSVKATKNVRFFKGYRSKTSGKEKEVDVKLTADMVSLAFLEEFDRLYLCTGDADFLQALFSIERFHNKKKIFLLCLENKVMYQGLFYFPTSIIVLKHEPIFKRRFRNTKIIRLDSRKVLVLI